MKLQLKKNKQKKGRPPRSINFSSGFSQEVSSSNYSAMKYIDTQFTALTGGCNILNLPIQGTTTSDRVGDIIEIEGIQIDQHLHMNGTAPVDQTRTIIFQTKGLYGAVPPAVTDLLEPIGGGVAPWSPYVFNSRETFEILWDSLVHQSFNGDTACISKTGIKVPAKIRRLRFELGGGIVYSGQLFMLQISWQGTIVGNMNIRLYFKD